MNETFQIPVLHIIRNPYDVLASQQRVKFPWLYDLKYFKQQVDLVNLVQQRFNFDINKTDSYNNLEILTIRWCLENVLPLQVFEPYQYKHRIVRYEDLRKDLSLFLDICKEFDLKPLDNIEREYTRPSSKIHPRSSIIDPTNKDKKFNEEERGQISRILNVFKCDLYPIEE